MILYGRGVRWFNNYLDEVVFSKLNEFDFIQVWYMKGKLLLDEVKNPKELHMQDAGFPTIIHAVYDINDYDQYNDELIRILKLLGHTEVIIHPVCESEPITSKTIYTLAERIQKTSHLLKEHDIKLYIENNSKIDPIFYKPEEIKILFDQNPDVELLLDLAHIDSYEHLEQILEIKYPTCLHIADKHFSTEHEHLPIGQGELDFELIFTQYLKDFEGKIIFEVIQSDEDIVASKQKIQSILNNR